MSLSRSLVVLVAVGLLHAASARADIPPLPRDLPAGKTMEDLTVKIDPEKDISILRIPRSALGDAGVEIREKKKEKPSAWMPGTTRSVVAALAMSLGIAGVFFARKKRGAAITIAVVATTIVGSLGVQAWGDLAPPPKKAEGKGSLTGDFHGHVVVEIIEDEGAVTLTVGTKPLPKYRRALPPDEAPNSDEKR